jgi:hypothetical protein
MEGQWQLVPAECHSAGLRFQAWRQLHPLVSSSSRRPSLQTGVSTATGGATRELVVEGEAEGVQDARIPTETTTKLCVMVDAAAMAEAGGAVEQDEQQLRVSTSSRGPPLAECLRSGCATTLQSMAV